MVPAPGAWPAATISCFTALMIVTCCVMPVPGSGAGESPDTGAGRSQRIWLLEEPSQLTRLSGARGSWGGWCWYQHELLLACGKQLYRWQSGSSRLQLWYQGDSAVGLMGADQQRLLYISASDFLQHGQLLLIQRDSGELLNQLALPPDIVAACVAEHQLWLQSANGDRYRVCLQSLQLIQTSHYQRHYDATMQLGVATVNSLSPCHRLLLEYGDLQPAAEQSCGLCWLRVVDLHNNQQLVLEKQYPSEILLACFSADESRVLTVHKDAAGGYQLCITGLNDV